MHCDLFISFVILLHLKSYDDGIRSVKIIRVVWGQFFFGEEANIFDTENFGSFLMLRDGGGEVFIGAHGEEESHHS